MMEGWIFVSWNPQVNTPMDIYESSENMKFSAAIGAFGLIMKQSEYKGTATKNMVLKLSKSAILFDSFGYRQEFIEMVSNWVE